jgi:hypothetical protein
VGYECGYRFSVEKGVHKQINRRIMDLGDCVLLTEVFCNPCRIIAVALLILVCNRSGFGRRLPSSHALR